MHSKYKANRDIVHIAMQDGEEPIIKEGSMHGKHWCEITIPGHAETYGCLSPLYGTAFDAREAAAMQAYTAIRNDEVQELPKNNLNNSTLNQHEAGENDTPWEVPPSSPPQLPASEANSEPTPSRSSPFQTFGEVSLSLRPKSSIEQRNHAVSPLKICFFARKSLLVEKCGKVSMKNAEGSQLDHPLSSHSWETTHQSGSNQEGVENNGQGEEVL
jgi:hypothetical protein